MIRWLVTGAGGLLGKEVVAALGGEALTAAFRRDLDITDAAAVEDAVCGHDIVINTAAWTAVDAAEDAEDAATLVNGTGVAHVAAACARYGALLIHLSTDYVFSGGSRPYPEDAPTTPINAYGRSKLAGERAVHTLLPLAGYVVRTAWLYGGGGANFVTTVLRLLRDHPTVDVVCDQYGQPTWTRALARQLRALGRAGHSGQAPPGVYHGTAAGQASWYELAQAVCAEKGIDPARIRPVSATQLCRAAPRPTYGVLGHGAWARTPVRPLGPWRAMLAEACGSGELDTPLDNRA